MKVKKKSPEATVVVGVVQVVVVVSLLPLAGDVCAGIERHIHGEPSGDPREELGHLERHVVEHLLLRQLTLESLPPNVRPLGGWRQVESEHFRPLGGTLL